MVTITASDGGDPPLSSTTEVVIDILDVNDEPPVFLNVLPLTLTIREGSDSLLGRVQATDPDEPNTPNSEVTFSIVGGTGMGVFDVNITSGYIMPISQLDFETDNRTVYNLTVQASDNGDPTMSSNRTYTIQVVDVDDNVPLFLNRTYDFDVEENGDPNAFIGRVEALDLDPHNRSIGYGFSEVVTEFRINSTSGEIFANNTVFNREETQPEFAFTVETFYEDDLIPTDFAGVVIVIVDIDEHPITIDDFEDILIEENPVIGTVLQQVNVTDQDPDSELFFELTISLDVLSIDNSTGQISVSRPIDREDTLLFPEGENLCPSGTSPDTSCLRFNVLVEDLTSGNFVRDARTLFVRDLDDEPPEFSQELYQITVNESLMLDFELTALNIQASDPDFSILPRYSIPESENITDFRIQEFSGVIVVNRQQLDFDTVPLYNFTILASDSNENAGSATVEITLTDINDNDPVFDELFYNATIVENSARLTVVEVVRATDADSGSNRELSYHIAGGNEDGFFDVRTLNGVGEVFLTQEVNREIDGEVVPLYSLTIEAADGGTFSRTGTTTLNVTISDENDHPPFFVTDTFSGVISESANIGDSVTDATTGLPLRLQAVDLDEESTVTIIVPPFLLPTLPFSVNTSTGYVTVSQLLDHDTVSEYPFFVYAQDERFVNSEPAFVVITVTAVNEHAPQFEEDPYEVDIAENDREGEVILQVVAVDSDFGDTLEYMIISDFNASEFVFSGSASGMTEQIFPFAINNETGEITLLEALDFEIEDLWEFTVIARDLEGLNDTTAVRINVEDLNDVSPRFTQRVYTISIAENTTINLLVPFDTSIRATDGDAISSGNLRYFIESGGEGTFLMDRFSGDLLLINELDLQVSRYELQLLVTDGENDDTSLAIIRVIDLNNNAPVFDQPSYTVSLPENVTADTFVLRVSATDDDFLTGGSGLGIVSYRLSSGSIELFYIDEDTGYIFTNNSEPFDFEEDPTEYYIQVEAYDDGLPPQSSFANVTILLSDVNDNEPEFDEDPFTFPVPEATSIGASVGVVTASDDDSGLNARVVFDVLTPNASFSIERETGTVRLESELDFDDLSRPKQIYLDILATDLGNPSLSSNGTLVINVTDSNDNAPVFSQFIFNIFVQENTTVNGTAFRVEAFDIDSGDNGRLTYDILSTLPSDCNTRFQIDAPSGEVILNEAVDAEERGEPCTLIIQASDNGDPRRSTQATFIVVVTDINELPPEIVVETLAVVENSPNGTIVGTLQATDPDGNGITFRVTGGNGEDFFDVSLQGVVTVAEDVVLDRESQSQLFLEIEARDDGIPEMSQFATVTIELIDENDSPPVFTQSVYRFSVREDHPLETPIDFVRANDSDIQPNNVVIYSLLPNFENETGYGKFDVDPETGGLLLIETLDYETKQRFYYLSVQANDSVAIDIAALHVRVLEANDQTPMFTNLPNAVTIPEDAGNDTLVFQASAVDTDLGVNGLITYTLDAVPGAEHFRIDPETGEIFVNGDDQFDFEGGIQEIELVVVATDNGGGESSADYDAPRGSGFGVEPLIDPTETQLSSMSTLTVTIADVNDEAPVFDMDTYTTLVIEHGGIVPIIVITVSASDGDRPNTNNSAVRYGIAGGDFGSFQIDPITGIIRTVPPIDQEERARYSVEVVAYDLGVPSLNSTAIVEVTVINTDDENPVFTTDLYTASVDENSSEGELVTTVSAIDPDEPATGAIDYTLFDVSGHFRINRTSGEIFTTALPIDREATQNFTITVQAQDVNNFFAIAQVFITVNDRNDERPEFQETSYFFSISENTPADFRLEGILAIDADIGSNAITRYDIQLLSGVPDRFTVDPLEGDIVVSGSLCFSDSENQNYTFDVIARDNLDENLNHTVSLMITVYEENISPPELVQPSYVSRLDDRAQEGTTVLPSLRTIDGDLCSGPPIFEIVAGNNGTFDINPSTGEVTLARDLTTDDLSFTATLRATDTGNFLVANLTSERTLIVLIGQLLPVSITVEGGLTVPTISRLSQLVYQQNVWLFNGGSLGDTPPTIRYSLGTLTETEPIEVEQSPALRVEAALAREEVYPGEPYVAVGLQVEAEGYERASVEPTEVWVRIESDDSTVAPLMDSSSSCTTQPPSATCVAQVMVPGSWFDPLITENRTARVYYGIASQPAANLLGTVSIATPAECPTPSGPQVRVILPSEVIYTGEYFDVSIVANAGYDILNYLLAFDLDEGIEFIEVSYSTPGFWTQTAVAENAFSVTGISFDPTFTAVTGLEELLTLRLRLSEDAPLTSQQTLDINCTVDFIVNSQLQEVFSSERAVHINFDESGPCNFTYGRVIAAPTSVVRLFPYADSSVILNSAYLNGYPAGSNITIIGLLNAGRFSDSLLGTTCESSDPSALKVADDCSQVYVNGTETRGGDPISVYVSSPYGSAQVPFRVWFPDGVAVEVGDRVLNPVSGVFDIESCRQIYETTTVEVDASFVAGKLRQSAFITPLVTNSIYSANDDIVRLATDSSVITAFGESPGSTEIRVSLFDGQVVASDIIQVTNTTVSVEEISFSLHSRLLPSGLLPPAFVGMSYLETSTVTLDTGLRYINTFVNVLTEAVLSNGRNFELADSHGLTLSSTDSEVLEVTDSDQFVIRGSGMGQFLTSTLDNSTCPGSIAFPGSEFVEVTLEEVAAVEVTVGTELLSIADHASILGYPYRTTIEVVLVHRDGTVTPVTSDSRTVYSTSSNVITVADGYIQSNGITGASNVAVTYTSADVMLTTMIGPIEVVGITSLQLSAIPYPYFSGAFDYEYPTVLERYANTSVFQQAEIEVLAFLSSDATLKATLHPSTTFDISEPSVIALNESIVTALDTGNSTLYAFLGGLNTSLEFTVPDSEILATGIAEFSLDLTDGRLTGTLEEDILPSLTLEFSDGTLYQNFITASRLVLPGFTEFSSSDPTAVTIDDSGVVRILQNTLENLSVTVAISENVSSSISFLADLLPRFGEVDIEGLVQQLDSGDNITLELYLNAEGASIGAIELQLEFPPGLLPNPLVPPEPGADLPEISVFEGSLEDQVFRLGGIIGEEIVGTERVHILTLNLVAVDSITDVTIVTEILTLNRRSSTYAPIGDPVPRVSLPASLLPLSYPNRTLTEIDRCPTPPCSVNECLNRTGFISAGDANADCVFDLIDALFIQEYAPRIPLLEPETTKLLPRQLEALDAYREGRFDLFDAVFLVRAFFGLHPLISDLTLRPIDAEFSDCRLTINVTLQEWNGDPPVDANTTIYFGLFHTSPEFQTQYDATTVSIGTKNSVIARPTDSFGGWLTPEYLGDGVYGIQTEPGPIAQTEIGFVLFYCSARCMEPNGAVIVIGPPTPPEQYGPLNASFPVVEGSVDITLPDFNPQQLFDNSFPERYCNNDNPPDITLGDPITLQLDENQPIGSSLRVVTANDPDDPLPQGQIQFSLEDISQAGTLDINATTGEIFVAGVLDREQYDRVLATVVATDQGPHVFTRMRNTVGFILLLDDVNDNPPLPDQLLYRVDISEGVVVPEGGESDPVFSFMGQDIDVELANRGISSVSITEGDDDPAGPFFSVAATSGSTLAGSLTLVRSLDRETQPYHNLTITIVDAGSPPQPTEFQVEVTVTDVNDQRPQFTSPSEATIQENLPSGQRVITVEATDGDIGSNAEFTLEISNVFEANDIGVPASDAPPLIGYFLINPSSRLIRTNRTFDREGMHSFRVNIITVEQGIPTTDSSVQSIWVRVCDENDETPTFSQEMFNATVLENSEDGTIVTQIEAVDDDLGSFCGSADDADADRNRMIEYEIETPGVPFIIDPVSGNISVNGSSELDFEDKSRRSYSFVIRASDLGDMPRSSTTNLTIFVTDENDNPPILSSTSYANPAVENNIISTIVIDFIAATDPDSGVNSIVRFNLTGAGSEDFSIDPVTGVISIAQSLDRERQARYDLVVTAFDLGTPSLSDTAAVVITVIDINDSPPVFNQTEYSLDLSENVAPGDVVLTVEAMDADDEDNRLITYRFEGSFSPLFEIDQFSGEIHTTDFICTRETVEYNFNLTAEDNPGGTLRLQMTVPVTIRVFDENRFDPEFTRISYAAIVPDGTNIGDEVVTVEVRDGDLCSAPFAYTLEPSTDSSFFMLNQSTGLLTANIALDGDVRDLYTVEISAVDSGSPTVRSGSTTVYIVVGEAVPVDFSINGGYPDRNGPRRASDSDNTFEQQFDFFFELARLGTVGRFETRFGSLVEDQQVAIDPFPSLRQPDARLLTTTVYHDSPMIYVAVQVLDIFGSAVQFQEVVVSATQNYGTFDTVNTTGTTVLAGTVTIGLPLPDGWFESADNESMTLNVSYALANNDQTNTFSETVTLLPRPEYAEVCENATSEPDRSLLIAQLPTYTLYNEGSADIPVLAYQSSDSVLSALALRCELEPGLQFSDPPFYSADGWVQRYEVDEPRRALSLAMSRVNFSSFDGFYQALALRIEVTSVAEDYLGITCYNLGAVDSNGDFEAYTEVLAVDRNGCQPQSGTIRISEDILIDAFAFSDQTVIINDAVLSGQRRTAALEIIGIVLSTVPYFSQVPSFDISADLDCYSENSDVLKAGVEFGSCIVYVDGTETAGSGRVLVTINATSISGNNRELSIEPAIFPVSVAFEVFYPDLPLTLTLEDSILNAVEDWTISDGSTCAQVYQRTNIVALATFTASPVSFNAEVRVDRLLEFSSDNSLVAEVSGSEVIGVGPGTVTVSAINSVRSNPIVGVITLLVTDIPVRTVDFAVYYSTPDFTAVVPDPILVYTNFTGPPFQATLDQNFRYETQSAEVVTIAVFSDGARNRLSSDLGLSYASRDASRIEASSTGFTVLDSGTEVPLEVTLSGCEPDQTVLSLTTPIDINLLVPEIRITVSSAILAHSDDLAASLNLINTSATITVTAIYPNELKLDVTESEFTRIEFSDSQLLTLVNGNTAEVALPNVSAVVNITATYREYTPAEQTIAIARTTSLVSNASPYPKFAGSGDIATTVLYTYGNTGVYQRARVVTTLTVEVAEDSPQVFDISSSLLDLRLSPEDVVTVSDDGLITVQAPGVVRITSEVFGRTSAFDLEVTTESVNVTSIDRLELTTGNTLSGLPGTISAILSATITLSDGTRLEEAYTPIGQIVPGLLSTESNSSDIFTVDSRLGFLTIIDSAVGTLSLTVTANDSAGITRELTFYSNLEPGVGELDLGDVTGPPVAPVNPGETFEVPIRINVGGSSVGALEVAVAYDSSLLELVGVVSSTDISGFVQTSGREFSGFIHLGGVLTETGSGVLHIATLEFTARDSASGVAAISGRIVTLLDSDSQPLTINLSPAADIGVIIGGPLLDETLPEIEIPLDILEPSVPECSGPLPCACAEGREIGDLNGDCIFNIADVLYLYRNQDSCDADFNIDGVCDERDIYFLLRANFHLVSFVQNLVVSPVDDTASINETDCFLTLEVQLITRGNRFADPSRTSLIFGLLHRDLGFQEQFDATTIFTSGEQALPSDGNFPASINGGFFQATAANNSFIAVLDTEISNTDVGLILVQARIDAYGLLNENQVEIMTGPDSIPVFFPEAINSGYFTHPVGFNISVASVLGVSPLLIFDQTFSTPDCINANNPRFFPTETTVEVLENIALGDVVVTVFANDSDAGANAEVVYSFFEPVTDEFRATFEINSTTGDIVLIATLDHETTTQYSAGLRAVDRGILGSRGGFGRLEITVLDVNDNEPVFEESVYTVAQPIREDIDIGALVLTVQATDADLVGSENSLISYRIQEPSYEFVINNETGVINIASSLDFETRMRYNLTVIAEDAGSPQLNSTAQVLIEVEPVNDNVPQCDPVEQIAFVTEDEFINSVILLVTVIDADLGADHALLTFELSPSAEFAIRKASDSTAEIYTIVVGFDRTLTPTYSLTVTASDVDGFNCSIAVMVVVAEPSRFDFEIQRPGAGYFTGPVTRRVAEDGFDQLVGFFENSFLSGAVTGNLGECSASASYERTPQPVSRVEAVLQQTEIWFDNPVITAVVQTRGPSLNSPAVGARVNLRIEPTDVFFEGTVSGADCIISESSPVCFVDVAVPEMWFSEYENVTVTLEAGPGLVAESLGTVTLNQKPTPSFPADNLVVQVPTYTLYPESDFTIWVGAAPSTSFIGFQINLEVSSNLTLGSLVGGDQWACTYEQRTTFATFVCLRVSFESTSASSIGITNFFGVQASVGSLSSATTATIRAEIISLTADYGSVISTPMLAHVFDRDGLKTNSEASVFLEAPSAVGILASSERAELINTYPLDGMIVPVPGLSAYIVYNIPGQPLVPSDLTSFTCEASESDVITVTDCTTVELGTRGSDETALTITLEPLNFSLPLRVWYPTNAWIEISDLELNWIDCASMYQRARVRVFADFTTGSETVSQVEVTNIVAEAGRIVSNDASIITVDGNYIRGVSPGYAEIYISGFSDTGINVTVSDYQVAPHSLEPTIFTALTVSVNPAAYDPPSTLTASALIARNFNDTGVFGFAAAILYFTDGARLDVSPESGLTLETSSEDYVRITPDQEIVTVSPGTAEIALVWQMGNCSVSAVSLVEVTAPSPTGLVIVPQSTTIAGRTDGLILDAPSSTEIIVFLLYSDGSTENITSEVTFSIPPSLEVVSSTPLTVAANVSYGGTSGDLTVQYTTSDGVELTDTANFIILNVMEIETRVQPYPGDGNGLFSISLEIIANTSYRQQARITTIAVLSDGSEQIVQPVYIIPPVVTVSISPDGIVTPREGEFGGGRITAESVNGNFTASFQVNALAETIAVTSVTLDLDDRRVITGISLDDGTTIGDIHDFNSTLAVDTLITYETDPPGLASVDYDSGVLMSTGNHYEDVTLIATAVGGATATTEFAANALPEVGQIDLGQDDGIPQPPVEVGEEFTIDARVSVSNNTVGALDVLLTYDPEALDLLSVDPTLPGFSAIRSNSPPGEIQIVYAAAEMTTSSMPTLAQIRFRAQLEGLAEINSFLRVLSDNSLEQNRIGTTDETSESGNLTVLIGSSPMNRFSRSPGVVPITTLGDTNNDGQFDARDAAYIARYLVDNELDVLTTEQMSTMDSNRDGVISIVDVVYLTRAAAGLVPFLDTIAIDSVSSETDCQLNVQASFALGPGVNYTFVYFVLSHPDIVPLLQVTTPQLESSVFSDPNSGILEALPSEDGSYYGISLFTPVDLQDIGLSVVLFTTDSELSISNDRFVSFLSAQDASDARVSQISGVTLVSVRETSVVNEDVTIGEPSGFTPSYPFNNSLRSDYCSFNDSTIQLLIDEDQAVGVPFETISAVYPGFPSNNETYVLIFESESGVFDLSSFGELQLATTLDFESVRNYTLRVRADLEGTVIGTATVEITVLDVNDNAPRFLNETYLIEIAEDAPIALSLLTVEARDEDSDINAEFFFSLDDVSGSLFAINATTGELSIESSLNRETAPFHDITVFATDLGSPPMTGNATIFVTVLDINDNAPLFVLDAIDNIPVPESGYITEVNENFFNESIDNNVLPDFRVFTFDPDAAENGTVILSFQFPDANASVPFEINADGTITVTESLDREQVQVYEIAVFAIDNSSIPLNSTTTLTIGIGDINDNLPVFAVDNDRMLILEEDMLMGTVITQIRASDQDSGNNSVITYSITEAGVPFEIDPASGEITIAGLLGVDARQSYSLSILAEDGGEPAMSNTWDLTIDLIEGQVVSFDAGESGFLVGLPSRSGEREYIQEVGFLFGEEIGTPAFVTGGINTVDSGEFDSAQVPNSGSTATQLSARILQPDVKHSVRMVTVFAQVFDERNVIAEPTAVRVRVIPSQSLGLVSLNGFCTTSADLGYCIAQVTLPDDWFDRPPTGTNFVNIFVNFASEIENGQAIGTLVLENSPAYVDDFVTPESPISLVGPSHAVFPGSNYRVEVFMASPLGSLFHTGFDADVATNRGTLVGIEFDEDIWDCSKLT